MRGRGQSFVREVREAGREAGAGRGALGLAASEPHAWWRIRAVFQDVCFPPPSPPHTGFPGAGGTHQLVLPLEAAGRARPQPPPSGHTSVREGPGAASAPLTPRAQGAVPCSSSCGHTSQRWPAAHVPALPTPLATCGGCSSGLETRSSSAAETWGPDARHAGPGVGARSGWALGQGAWWLRSWAPGQLCPSAAAHPPAACTAAPCLSSAVRKVGCCPRP